MPSPTSPTQMNAKLSIAGPFKKAKMAFGNTIKKKIA
jgi:hypothetical protein